MKGFSLFVLLILVLPMFAIAENDYAEQIRNLQSKRNVLSAKMSKMSAEMEASLQGPYLLNDEIHSLPTHESLKNATTILFELETDERVMQKMESEIDFYFENFHERPMRDSRKEAEIHETLRKRFELLVTEIVAARSSSLRSLQKAMELGNSRLDEQKANHLRLVMIPFYDEKVRLLLDRNQTEILKSEAVNLPYELADGLLAFIREQRFEITKRRNELSFKTLNHRTDCDSQAYLETYAVILNQFDNAEKKLKKLFQ